MKYIHRLLVGSTYGIQVTSALDLGHVCFAKPRYSDVEIVDATFLHVPLKRSRDSLRLMDVFVHLISRHKISATARKAIHGRTDGGEFEL